MATTRAGHASSLARSRYNLTVTDRFCVKPTCRNYADFTLSYDYEARVMVIGPLAPEQASGGYDLCEVHAGRLKAPSDWTLIRNPGNP